MENESVTSTTDDPSHVRDAIQRERESERQETIQTYIGTNIYMGRERENDLKNEIFINDTRRLNENLSVREIDTT